MYRWFLSLRYLRARKTNWIGAAGIFVAVAALILILSIMSGFLAESRGHLRGNLSDVLVTPRLDYPTPATGELPPRDPGPMMERIRELPQVESAGLELVWYGMLAQEGGGQRISNPLVGDLSLVQLVGVDVQDEYATTDLLESLEATARPHPLFGATPQVDDLQDPFRQPANYSPDGAPKESIVLGFQLCRALYLDKGDEVEIVTVSIDPDTGRIGEPSNRTFVVAGSFRSGEMEMDVERIYMERSVLADFLGREADWSQVLVKLHDYERDKAQVVAALREELFEAGYLHTLDPTHRTFGREVQTWEDFKGSLLGAIENEKALMGVMLSLVMIVAGFTVFALLSMMVSEKRRDIGIITALGATPRGVLMLFLLIGCWQALLGATLGTLAGIWAAVRIDPIERWLSDVFGVQIFNRKVYIFDHIPSEIQPYGVAGIVLGAVLCTLLFASFPAWRAARLNPVDALRYE